jgi:cardiolipin synthase
LNINLATRITLARIFLVPLLAVMLVQRRYDVALGVYVVAALSDALDGIVARRMNQRTTLGAILDPLADKAMILTAFILLGQASEPHLALPAWLVIFVVFRDLYIVVGIGVFHMIHGSVPWGASWISKVNTVAQIMTVLAALIANAMIEQGWAGVTLQALEMLLTAMIWLTLTTTIVTGIDYTLRGVHILSEDHGDTDGQPADRTAHE